MYKVFNVPVHVVYIDYKNFNHFFNYTFSSFNYYFPLNYGDTFVIMVQEVFDC